MNAEGLFKSGDLAACKAQLFTEIKKDPSNINLRIFLFQLSCIEQDWKRAITQLDVLKDLSDSTLAMVNTYKQLIECELRRQKVLSGDIEPICFGEPSDWLACYVKAYKQYCDGNIEQAEKLIGQGIESASAVSGSVDEQPFEWLSDGDVRFGPSIEVMLNGGYYWLPLENVAEINFEPVEDLRDMVWRPANLTLKNKGQLIVFMPVRYPINSETSDSELLSRECNWHEPKEQFYVGSGQRVFITNDAEFPILNINSIQFNHE